MEAAGGEGRGDAPELQRGAQEGAAQRLALAVVEVLEAVGGAEAEGRVLLPVQVEQGAQEAPGARGAVGAHLALVQDAVAVAGLQVAREVDLPGEHLVRDQVHDPLPLLAREVGAPAVQHGLVERRAHLAREGGGVHADRDLLHLRVPLPPVALHAQGAVGVQRHLHPPHLAAREALAVGDHRAGAEPARVLMLPQLRQERRRVRGVQPRALQQLGKGLPRAEGVLEGQLRRARVRRGEERRGRRGRVPGGGDVHERRHPRQADGREDAGGDDPVRFRHLSRKLGSPKKAGGAARQGAAPSASRFSPSAGG